MMPDIVISGISGRFPESNNLDEFWNNLLHGVDMISENNCRWDADAFESPTRIGKLPHLDKFDSGYFSVHEKLGHVMDPRQKTILPLTYEALVDAGVNPTAVRNRNIGVFVGAGDWEAYDIWKYMGKNVSEYAAIGCASTMLANRISFSFDFHGPSYTVDAACASSAVALHNAFLSMSSGICDAAIVAGVSVCFSPFLSHDYHKLQMTSKEGRCKAFDAGASGYVRAEAAVVLYLSSKTSAKRSYAGIVHVKCSSDGFKEKGITFPGGRSQETLLLEFYKECQLSPLAVDYVEVHGTGTPAGDPEELGAVSNVFCEGRQGALLVGSVKSNMGHAEPASGLCGIAKVLLAHRHEVLPGNLHYKTPNPNIPSLLDGRIKVVDRNMDFKGVYAALNSFGFGGTNVHVLLQLTPKAPSTSWCPGIPILVPFSCRTHESAEYFLNCLEPNKEHRNVAALLHHIATANTPKLPYRCYALSQDNKFESRISDDLSSGSSARRPLWFIYPGVGSQWPGMAKDMFKFKVFQDSIRKSAEVLQEHHNYDLMEVLNFGDEIAFDFTKNITICLTVMQVALTQLLESVGLTCDGIIGHSNGETAASHADGCFTHAQAVLAGLARGRAYVESNLPAANIASVGLTWDEATKQCPPGIVPIIHNAKQNVSVTGPPALIQGFVQELKDKGIFAKLVRGANCGYHSHYIQDCEPLMRELLGEIIQDPSKPRSSRWLSSCIPALDWDSELAKYSSVDYHLKNILSPVLFYDTIQHIPGNAIVVEISPHCFFQTLLKQSLPPTVAKVGLMSRQSESNDKFFLTALGNLYLEGVSLDLSPLYGPVHFPVGPETPMISPWIKWNEDQIWEVPYFRHVQAHNTDSFTIDLSSEAHKFLEGHSVDGRIIFPGMGYLWLVWKAFAKAQGKSFEKLGVVFENIRMEQFIMLTAPTEFSVNIQTNSGEFELTRGRDTLARGTIRQFRDTINSEVYNFAPPAALQKSDGKTLRMTGTDFYKDERLRGYEYSGKFRGVQELRMAGEDAEAFVAWQGSWVGFLDTLLQVILVTTKGQDRHLWLPTRIQKLTIDPPRFKEGVAAATEVPKVEFSGTLQTLQCAGIELRRLDPVSGPRKLNLIDPIIAESKFLPFIDDGSYSFQDALSFMIGIVMDNIKAGANFILTECFTCSGCTSVAGVVSSHFSASSFGGFECRLRLFHELAKEVEDSQNRSELISNSELLGSDPCHLLYCDGIPEITEAVADPLELVALGGFLLFTGNIHSQPKGFELISRKDSPEAMLFLYRKQAKLSPEVYSVMVEAEDFSWVENVKEYVKSKSRLALFSKSPSGVCGLVKCLLREHHNNVRCFYFETDVKQFQVDPGSELIRSQLNLDLAFNVYSDGVWGCYGNLILPKEELVRARHGLKHIFAKVKIPQNLSSLTWIEGPWKLKEATSLCHVTHVALNFRDALMSTGKVMTRRVLPEDDGECGLGRDFAGIYGSNRVFGTQGAKHFIGTTLDVGDAPLLPVPERWTLAEASTVLSAYGTAYNALKLKARVKEGETVLIHAGAGGTGLAAITVALSLKCKIFTSVGSNEKREFLKTRFPNYLTDASITSSRSAAEFERHVLERTGGEGVDVVLSSLSDGELQAASLGCLKRHGRFLHIGKSDVLSGSGNSMSLMLKSVEVHDVLFESVLAHQNSDPEFLRKIMALVQTGIDSGVVQPLPHSLFPIEKLEDGVIFLAQGKNIGKVVMEMDSRSGKGNNSIPALPRTYFPSFKSYVIIGGLGGMSLEMIEWMTERGARRFLLNSRAGIKTSFQAYRVHHLQKRGVKLEIDTGDASTPEGATAMLEKAAALLGPIGGIFNTAVVLQDALFVNQTPHSFETASRAKVRVTLELDRASRTLAPELDYFVVFSSIVSGMGNPGQTNYGFANSFMESVCERRRVAGLPALAIQWGGIDDVGFIFGNEKLGKSFEALGFIPQRVQSWITTLDQLLQQPKRTILSSFVRVQPERTVDVFKKSLVDAVAHVLDIRDVSKINFNASLTELGLDSLMSAEIKQLLDSRTVSAIIPEDLTFSKLMELDGDVKLIKEEGQKLEAEVL